MPRILPIRNVFALLILTGLLIGAIGILLALLRSDEPADSNREKPSAPTSSAR